MDSYGKKAGKGALIQTEVSATLGVSQDQYLFQPTATELPTRVDFGRVADRIYINADKSVTLQSLGGGMGAKTGLYLLPESHCDAEHGEGSYGFDRYAFNQGQNAKYNFLVIEEQAPTVVARGPGGVFQAVKSSSTNTP